MRARLLCVLLLTAGLAGCLSDPTPAGDARAPEIPGLEAVANVAPPMNVALPVTDPAGQPSTIEALVWPVETATTAVLLVHGLAGTAQRIYHVLPEAGYSLGAYLSLTGRTAIAVDLPGYGESPGPAEGLPVEEHARTVNELAQRLKEGVDDVGLPAFDRVVAYGISMGGLTVTVAGGSGDELDAIVPVASNHAGLHLPLRCLFVSEADDSCPSPTEASFWEPNAEPEVIEATMALAEPADEHGAEIASSLALLGGCGPIKASTDDATCDPYGTRLDEYSDQVQVPVLSLVGLKDLQFDPEGWEDEPNHFPNSPDARVHAFEATGHLIHHHLVQPEVVEIVDGFLDDGGL